MDSSTIVTLLLGAAVIWLIVKRFIPVKGLRQLSDQSFQQLLKETNQKQLIDVREPHEFNNSHIAGAVNVPLSVLSSRMDELPRDKEVFLYCQSGMRSRRAAQILLRNGFAQVTHLNGGMMSWTGKKTK